MYRSMHLLKHMEYMRMVFFGAQGDFLSAFHQNVFNNDFQQTVLESTLYFLNSKLEQSCYMQAEPQAQMVDISSGDQSGGQSSFQFSTTLAHAIKDFQFEFASESVKLVDNPSFFFTVGNVSYLFFFNLVKLGDYIRLKYNTQHPVDRVISQMCQLKYNKIFFFLLKIKRAKHCLSLIWKELNLPEYRVSNRSAANCLQRLGSKEQQVLRKMQFLRQHMHYFASLLEEYVMFEVIQSEWLHFKKALTSISLFEELVDLHNNYLNAILEKCFLRGTVRDGNTDIELAQEKKLQSIFSLIFSQIFKLNHLIREYGTSICT